MSVHWKPIKFQSEKKGLAICVKPGISMDGRWHYREWESYQYDLVLNPITGIKTYRVEHSSKRHVEVFSPSAFKGAFVVQ